MKKFALVIAVIMLFTALCTFAQAKDNFDIDVKYDITGFDAEPSSSGVVVYPNESDEPRVIGTEEYNFRSASVLIFDGKGRLAEAGGDLLANTNGVNGSAQLSVTVPAKGFMVAFGSGAPSGLAACKKTAMEGAMLYNATMSVIYEVYGSYDRSSSTLRIKYNNPKEPSENAKKFLFVGNSLTYFNGGPIKFKGLALAAGIEVDVDYSTFGSAYLSEFADENHERGKFLREKLSSNSYDYVSLQDMSGVRYDQSSPALNVIVPLVEANGAKPLIYMPFAYASDPLGRVSVAAKINKSCVRLAADYDTVFAPGADAFVICTEKYPDIVLYADDNSHQSAAGSYLVACTWLYAYLGVDPRGNSYKAGLSKEVASALQECAYLACAEGYEYPDEEKSKYTVDGVTYHNTAVGCGYTSNGGVYSGKWTDTGEDGKPLGKFTDGEFTVNGSDIEAACYTGSKTDITVDLGCVREIKRVYTDLFGGTWGIGDPQSASVRISVSTDGKNYSDLGNALMSEELSADAEWRKRDFTLDNEELVNARFVRVSYTIAGSFLWSSEIAVYTTENEIGIPEESTEESAADESAASGAESAGPVSSDESEEVVGDGSGKTAMLVCIGIAAAIAVAVAAVIIAKKKKIK